MLHVRLVAETAQVMLIACVLGDGDNGTTPVGALEGIVLRNRAHGRAEGADGADGSEEHGGGRGDTRETHGGGCVCSEDGRADGGGDGCCARAALCDAPNCCRGWITERVGGGGEV